MKSVKKYAFFTVLLCLVMSAVLAFNASAASVSTAQIINAASEIIYQNEGSYGSVNPNDNGAVSIGKIQWHATNALSLLKSIVAANPQQALNILGTSLYNEIVTSQNWESRKFTSSECSVTSVLLTTAEGKKAQDAAAYSYISGYVSHGMKLGITEPEALVFFADYQNQNGYSGAESFYYSVKSSYGTVNLATLYNGSSKNERRTRVYNYCATLNWSNISGQTSTNTDTTPPEISDVSITNLTSSGYTVSCKVSDKSGVSQVYFPVYYTSDGENAVIWNKGTIKDGIASFTVEVSNFSNRTGNYSTYIYAFDTAGNYTYAELNTVKVPSNAPIEVPLSLTVSSDISAGEVGKTIRWTASAGGGKGNYQYQFDLYKDGELIDTRNYVDYQSYTYMAKEAGKYLVKVSVKDNAGTVAMASSKSVSINVPIVVGSFAATKTAAVVGEVVGWKINATGGEGTLMYSYTVYCDDIILYSGNYSDKSEFLYKPSIGGVFTVTVNIKDENSQVKSVQSRNLTVIYPLSADDVNFSEQYAVTGKSITCSVGVSGGTGEYTCVFSIYCDGEKVLTSDSLKSDKYTFSVPKAGNYTASVTVTDLDTSEITVSGGHLMSDDTAQKGDANLDGVVNAADARFALRCSAKLDTPEQGLEYAADVDGDGKITASDARKILRVVARLETF